MAYIIILLFHILETTMTTIQVVVLAIEYIGTFIQHESQTT